MTGAGVREPQGSLLVIDGIPDPPTRGHFELPLLHRLTQNDDGSQPAFQAMLPAVDAARIARNGNPSPIDGRQHLASEFVPSFGGLPVYSAHDPWLGTRYLVASFGHSDSGSGRGMSSPVPSNGPLRWRARSASAHTSAVDRQAVIVWANGNRVPVSAPADRSANRSATHWMRSSAGSQRIQGNSSVNNSATRSGSRRASVRSTCAAATIADRPAEKRSERIRTRFSASRRSRTTAA